MPVAPWLIRWGHDAASDMLRRSAWRGQCGGRVAVIHLPRWGDRKAPVSDRRSRSASTETANSSLCVPPLEQLFDLSGRQSSVLVQGLGDPEDLGALLQD